MTRLIDKSYLHYCIMLLSASLIAMIYFTNCPKAVHFHKCAFPNVWFCHVTEPQPLQIASLNGIGGLVVKLAVANEI